MSSLRPPIASALLRLHFELRYLFGDAPWDTGISPPELLAFLDSHPAGRALDIGCGTGTNALTMASRGWQVIGIDFAWGAIWRAREKASRAGLEIDFHRGDVRAVEAVDGPIDLALDIGCFHAMDSARRARYARHLGRLVRPGGAFLLYAFLTSSDPSGVSRAEILQLFVPPFQIVRFDQGTDRDRPSAWFHLQHAG